jgi:nucleoside-diphosphate-sugar epimerase
MRVFVTGATGAIGRRVIPSLVALGHDVTALGRTPEKRAALERQGARPILVDLFDPFALRTALEGAEAVLNLATAVPPGMRAFLPWSWKPMDRIRTHASANLVDAALAGHDVRILVQESFAPIYADGGDRWLDESSPVRPVRYNRSTLDAEASAGRFTRAGRTGVVLRFALFSGPGDPFTQMMLDSVRRGWFPLLGRPEAYTSWISHQDAASAAVAALGLPAGIYNAVDDQPLRRRELADGIARLLGVKPPRLLPAWAVSLAGSVGDALGRSVRISNRKLREAGEWRPKHPSVLEGLAA